MRLGAKKHRRRLAAALLCCTGLACSPLHICQSDEGCLAPERCFKGQEESADAEGICLAPTCESDCKGIEFCAWDVVEWEAHCVALPL